MAFRGDHMSKTLSKYVEIAGLGGVVRPELSLYPAGSGK